MTTTTKKLLALGMGRVLITSKLTNHPILLSGLSQAMLRTRIHGSLIAPVDSIIAHPPATLEAILLGKCPPSLMSLKSQIAAVKESVK